MRALISVAKIGHPEVEIFIDTHNLMRELEENNIPYEIKSHMPGWLKQNHKWIEFEYDLVLNDKSAPYSCAFKPEPLKSFPDILNKEYDYMVQISLINEDGSLTPINS